MKKIKITRDCFIKGVSYAAGAVADCSEGDAELIVGLGKAIHHSGEEAVKKKKKKK